MGCWNGTCMISNLPIISGEKIKLVLLREGYENGNVSGKSGFVYPGDFLTPAFLPITGNYNDYGNIEDIEEDWNYNLIQDNLKELFGNLIETDDGEVENWQLPHLFHGIERGGKYTESPKFKNKKGEWENCNISMVMIRQDVWDLCVGLRKKGGSYFSEDGFINGENWGNKTFDKFIEGIKKIFNTNDPKEALMYRFALSDRHVFSNSECKPMYGDNDYKKLCEENRDNDIFLQDIKKRWFESNMIDDYLGALRKSWMIQSGGGSQDGDWEQYILFSEGIIDICNNKLQEEF